MQRGMALCLLSVVALLGCGKRDSGPPRFVLEGTVTLDGAPLDGATITFMPTDLKNRPSGGPISTGKYSVSQGQGANAGPHRVEIRWPKPTGKKIKDEDTGEMIDVVAEGLPVRYHDQSELKADVGPEKTKHDFDLTSKK